MEGLFILFVVGLVFRALTKSAKRAGGGARPVPPPRPAVPPLTPAARPGDGQAGWQEIMTMLSGQPQAEREEAEGVSTESTGPSGSLTGPSMMDGTGMMEGSAPMMDESAPDYEGASLPGELSSDAVAVLPESDEPAAPAHPAFAVRRDYTALREAVVWAEILGRPKARRVWRAVR